MTTTEPAWTVVDETLGLLRAEYSFGQGSATSLVVPLGGGELALISPPTGPKAAVLLEALSFHGVVTALVAPNGNHRLGIAPAQQRFLDAPLYAPDMVLDRVAQRSRAGRPPRPLGEFLARLPRGVEFLVPPHVKRPDLVGRFETAGGALWYLNDLVVNLESLGSPPLSWLLRVLGFRTGLSVNRFGCRSVMVADRPAFAQWFAHELRSRPPVGIVFGHGPPLTGPELFVGLGEDMRETLGVRRAIAGG
jgi:hypothetical protein